MSVDDLPGVLFWAKDLHHSYSGNNRHFANFFGFARGSEMIGLSDYDLRCEAAELAEIFQRCDRYVSDNNRTMKFFEILKSADNDVRIMLVNKAPVFDAQNIIKGTFGHAVDVTLAFFKLGLVISNPIGEKKLVPSSFTVGEPAENMIPLTARQAECLFFSLRHKTAKQIALILKISFRTVEEYTEQLKIKFNCCSKTEMLEKAMHLGYFQIIPSSIFNTQLSFALD